MDIDERIFDLTSRLDRHEARCEERDKTMFSRLDNLDKQFRDLHSLLTKFGIIVITGMAGLIISLML